jgi:NADH-quinone oxidoreductase subunit D
MGPQHPATHGVLRIEISTDSEIVAHAIPHLGYLHRSMEKHAENLDFRGVIPFVDRLDYLASMNMEWTYAMAIEKMLGTEVPRRAELLRILTGELQRIASHLMAFGTYALDLGAFTPFLYAFDYREKILRLFEEVSGARLLYNYIWIGGLWNDWTDDQLVRVGQFCDEMEEEAKKYHELVSLNKIFVQRTANVGIMTVQDCLDFGASGPVLRRSLSLTNLSAKKVCTPMPAFFLSAIAPGRSVGIKLCNQAMLHDHSITTASIESTVNYC